MLDAAPPSATQRWYSTPRIAALQKILVKILLSWFNYFIMKSNFTFIMLMEGWSGSKKLEPLLANPFPHDLRPVQICWLIKFNLDISHFSRFLKRTAQLSYINIIILRGGFRQGLNLPGVCCWVESLTTTPSFGRPAMVCGGRDNFYRLEHLLPPVVHEFLRLLDYYVQTTQCR